MSKKNPVNPDHYKVSGRGLQGEGILKDEQQQKLAQSRSKSKKKRRRK
jgi:hypothetical protein